MLAVDVDTRRVVGALHNFVRHTTHLGAYLVVGLAHETLDGINGTQRVGDGLTFGRLADLTLAAVGDGDHGRGGAVAFAVGDDNRLVAFHNGHT